MYIIVDKIIDNIVKNIVDQIVNNIVWIKFDSYAQIVISVPPFLYLPQTDEADQGGNTCLMYAAKEGHVSIVRLLLKQGAHPDKVNSYGWTATMQVRGRCLCGLTTFLQGFIAKIPGIEPIYSLRGGGGVSADIFKTSFIR